MKALPEGEDEEDDDDDDDEALRNKPSVPQETRPGSFREPESRSAPR